MSKQNIVIAGAGFGGITTAITLAANHRSLQHYSVILIDKNPYQLYTPALYEIAAIPRINAGTTQLHHTIAIPLKEIIDRKNIQFLQGELTAIDRIAKKITLGGGGVVEYTFLVLALGSKTNYFNVPGLEQHAYPLKNFHDGVLLRDTIEKLAATKKELRIVIGGGGATGVELAAEFVNFICGLQKIYEKENICRSEVLIIQSSHTILSDFSPWIIKKAEERLKKIGVLVKTNTTITSIEETLIHTNQGVIPYDFLIWTGGTRGADILATLGLPVNGRGLLTIDQYLAVEPNIFAIGDNASLVGKNGKPLPANIPVAESQGKSVAQNIIRIIKKKHIKPFFATKKYPYILSVGKKYAIADLVFLRFAGFFGWILKQIVELRYLLFILPPKKALRTWIYTIRMYSSNDY